MSLGRRWPLHPRPLAGETLSSWLTRIADVHDLGIDELLRYNLGSVRVDPWRDLAGLDVDPPAVVLDVLAERTGVPTPDLARMAVSGWIPWLLDTLEHHSDAYATYVRQDCVLLAPGEAPPRNPARWRPWLAREPMRRGCPLCMSGSTPAFSLVSQIPLTLSCPEHGCRLQATSGVPGRFLGWATTSGEPVAAGAAVQTMDRLTYEGMATGMVTLPRRSVHLGVWLRLLRGLLDEVNTPLSLVRRASARTIRQIWAAAGQRIRAGETAWRPYESLDWSVQQAMLEAAAAALHLAETGSITPHGSLGPLLQAEPYRPASDGVPPRLSDRRIDVANPARDRAGDALQEATTVLQDAIAAAQADPNSARQLLGVITEFWRSSCPIRTRSPSLCRS